MALTCLDIGDSGPLWLCPVQLVETFFLWFAQADVRHLSPLTALTHLDLGEADGFAVAKLAASLPLLESLSLDLMRRMVLMPPVGPLS